MIGTTEKARATLLAAVMVLSVVAMSTAFAGAAAANNHDVDVEFGDYNAEQGETINVTVSAESAGDNSAGVAGFELDMEFDSDKLVYQDYYTDDSDFSPTVNDNEAIDGVLSAVAGNAQDTDTPATFVTFQFQVDPTADGEATLSFNESESSIHSVGGQVEAQFNAGTVTIGESQEPTLESIDLELDETTLSEGDTTRATVTANYADGTTADVTSEASISSDDTSVASVTDATVTAEGDGDASITADYEGESDSVGLTVDSGAWYDDYVNENNEVTNSGLSDAFVDWTAGDLSNDRLAIVFNSWTTGDPIEE